MSFSGIIPPQNVEAEKRVLASCMHTAVVLDHCCCTLSKNHFYDRIHQKVWSVLKEINAKGYDVDLVQMGGDEKLKGLESYIAELYSIVATTPTVDGISSTIKRLDNQRIQRECLNATLETIGIINSDDDHENKTDRILGAIGSIGDSVEKRSGLKHIKEFIPMASRQFEQALNGESQGVLTGISDFDREVNGLHRGEYTIVSGRPGDGKSTVAFAVGINMALAGESVGVFTLEMQGKKVTNRMACSVANGTLRNNHIRGVEKPKQEVLMEYQNSMTKLSKLKIYLDDTPKTTNLSIISSLRSFIKKNDLSVIIIDHFSLIDYEGSNKGGKAYERKEEITRGIQRILKELDLIGIILVQLGRDSQNRRPRLSDLSDTKALEQDANNVLMIWNPIHGDREHRVLCCEKGRDGGTGDYYTHFHGDTCKVESMLPTEQDAYYDQFAGNSGNKNNDGPEKSWNERF